MARRRGIVFAVDAFAAMETAVGYVDPSLVRDVLKEHINVELDFDALERRAERAINPACRAEIADEVNIAAYHIARAHLEKGGGAVDLQLGRIPSGMAYESEFSKLIDQIQKKRRS